MREGTIFEAFTWSAATPALAIVWAQTSVQPALGVSHQSAMNEPRFAKNHRANILNPEFTDVGIGIVRGPDGGLYITQDFYTGLSHPEATSALPPGDR